MKEQALPALAARHYVSVVQWPKLAGMSIRTLSQYVKALRYVHRRAAVDPGATDAFHEDWKQTFAIVEPDANVAANAVIHDSVVLNGARVTRGPWWLGRLSARERLLRAVGWWSTKLSRGVNEVDERDVRSVVV